MKIRKILATIGCVMLVLSLLLFATIVGQWLFRDTQETGYFCEAYLLALTLVVGIFLIIQNEI